MNDGVIAAVDFVAGKKQQAYIIMYQMKPATGNSNVTAVKVDSCQRK